MALITITEPQQIAGLLDLVHDWWFDVEKISHDQSTGTATLFFAAKQKELFSSSGKGVVLKINSVRKIEIKDTERVGYYDLNEISYNAASKTLKITGGVPIEINFITDGLNIEASRSDAPQVNQ